MSVRKRLENPKIQEVDVEKLIEKGAKVKEDDSENIEKPRTNINLRMPVPMLEEIDQALKNRIGISRTGWILEAIHEKIQKEEKERNDRAK